MRQKVGLRSSRSSHFSYFARLAGGLALCVMAATCKGPGPKKIGDATLAPLAAGGKTLSEDAKKAPLVVVLPDSQPTIPDVEMVQLAIDRHVSWGMVKAIIDRMYEHGQTPVLLVAQRQKVLELALSDELLGPPLEVYAQLEGKLCVKHPAAEEMICTQTYSKKYIDGAHTRELVRKAVLGYERADVQVELLPALNWGDVVTAVGATRSCCGKREVRVRLIDSPTDRLVDSPTEG